MNFKVISQLLFLQVTTLTVFVGGMIYSGMEDDMLRRAATMIVVSALVVLLGQFGLNEVFDEFDTEGYHVHLIYRGMTSTTSLRLYVVASPENPIVANGYVEVYRKSTTAPFVFDIAGIVYEATPAAANCLSISRRE